MRELRRSLAALGRRREFRVIHFSIQADHAHFLVEADGRAALGRGMMAVGSRLARAAAESPRAQLVWATLFLTGFVGFAMWWIWYWMLLGRNATLRELKRPELQIAELRAAYPSSPRK